MSLECIKMLTSLLGVAVDCPLEGNFFAPMQHILSCANLSFHPYAHLCDNLFTAGYSGRFEDGT